MSAETGDSFACFGSTCSVAVGGAAAGDAVRLARERLLAWDERFSRFSPDSELSRLNADPREVVPVSPIMASFLTAAIAAAQQSEGLVDATLLPELEAAGYVGDLAEGAPLAGAFGEAPDRRAAQGRPGAPWRAVSVLRRAVRRPPGLRFDSGGVAKGLFADLIGAALGGQDSFAVECAGDMRVGGSAGLPRPVQVISPFDGSVIHAFELTASGVATSGIGKRSWLDRGGAFTHHLLDPSTGRPAFTGVVQATALAPTALLAEVRAKAALLSGPAGANRWLPDGGVLVLDDGSVQHLDPGGETLSRRAPQLRPAA